MKKINPYLTCLLFASLFITLPGRVTAQQTLKIMSYNIHHGQDSYDKDQLRQMAELIKKENPDIVGLQEVDSVCLRSGKINQAEALALLTGMHYAFTRHFAFEGGAYGNAVLSKFPIANVINHRLPVATETKGASVSFLTGEISLSRKKRITIGVAHLDYRSQQSRVNQATMIATLFKTSKFPVILMGDLNAEPKTEEIELLLQSFKDTQPDTMLSFPTLKPVKKIDYILIDRAHKVKVLDSKVIPAQYSDHLPILSTIEL